MQSGSDEFLRLYLGQVVIIRRDNDERHKSRVDRIMDVDNGQFKLQDEGWILPDDVLFVVSDRADDAFIIEQAQFFRISYDEAQALPAAVRRFQARADSPKYKQFQEIVHQPPGDAKAIKIRVLRVYPEGDDWRYQVEQKGKMLDGLFSDADIRTFEEKGYLPMPETTSEVETKVPQPPAGDEALRKQIAALETQVQALLKQSKATVSQMDALIAQDDLVQVMQKMTAIIAQQGRMLREAAMPSPRQTLTYKRLLNTSIQEGDPTDTDLNRLLKQGWSIASDQLVMQPGKESPLRVVRLERNSQPEPPQLNNATEMILHQGPMRLGDELIMTGVDTTKARLNQAVMNAARNRFNARKASQSGAQPS